MRILTIVFGVLLTTLGIGNFVASGMGRVATLTPAFLGLLIGILGVIALSDRKGYHSGRDPVGNYPLFGAIMLAMLAFLGSLGGMFTLLSGGPSASSTMVMVQSIIGLICVTFIILALLLIKDFWQGWKAFGHFLGNMLGRIVLTLFYFTVFAPFALGVKIFSDPLQIKNLPASFWQPRSTGDQTLEDITRQY